MNVSDFYYDLPQELIAQTPITNRAESCLMCVNRNNGDINHDHFYNIKNYLRPGDCLVLNDTRVIPARLIGVKEGSESPMEFVLLNRINRTDWEVLVRPGKRAKIGARFSFGEGLIKAEVIDIIKEDGNRIVRLEWDGIFEEVLDKVGVMPLPPYIKAKLNDPERYQTVYARERGSAAAPTAGLHFTKELLEEIREMGVNIAYVTLHVGLGTFRPVKTEKVEDHLMHKEIFTITAENAEIINRAKQNGGRVIAVGTTSCRVLETASDENGVIYPMSDSTRIYIYPGYKFKIMDCLITNFHLPESTLLMLVSAFSSKEIIMKAYKEAVSEKYRFFSFGDAMFLYRG